MPQGQGHRNSVSQLLWTRSTYPTLSTFPVGGNRSTRRKPTTFGRALTLLFSHEDWVRVRLAGDRARNLRGERKSEWSDHYTTEAPTPPKPRKFKMAEAEQQEIEEPQELEEINLCVEKMIFLFDIIHH